MAQRRQYEDYIKRLRRQRPLIRDIDLPPLHLKLLENASVTTIKDFESKGISNQSVIDTIYYLTAKFSVQLDTEGSHMMEKAYKTEISKIQNQSAVIFFILVQVPLSRMSIAWSFVTCMITWCLDCQTKQWIHDTVGACLRLDIEKLAKLFLKELEYSQVPFREKKAK